MDAIAPDGLIGKNVHSSGILSLVEVNTSALLVWIARLHVTGAVAQVIIPR